MKLLSTLLFSILLSTCAKDHQDEKAPEQIEIKNLNVIIAPDLSNRIDPKIHPKPVNDTVIINGLYDAIENRFLKIGGRSSLQKDTYILDFINRGALNSENINSEDFIIDFEKFGTKQLLRSDYIRSGLKKDVSRCKSHVKLLYDTQIKNPSGSDIYSYLNSTVNNVLSNSSVEKFELSPGIEGVVSTENIIILFTDGYIENATTQKGYNLSKKTIDKIRVDFNKTKSDDLETFIKDNPSYLIKPLKNPSLAEVNLIVVEMVDRSTDKNGVSVLHPTDFEIMAAVWSQWLKQSNCHNFKFVPAQNSADQVISQISIFIEKSIAKNNK